MRKTIERIKSLLAGKHGKAIAAATSIALVVIALAVGSCALQESQEPQGQTDYEAQTAVGEAQEDTGAETSEEADDEKQEEADESAAGDVSAEPAAAQTQKAEEDRSESAGSGVTSSDHKGQSQSSSSESSQSGSSSSGSKTTDSMKWVEETSKVWVVDKEAWSEEVPVYSTVEKSICNICGADITGSTSAHNKAHMLAGEGSGYHSETQRVQTGTNTVKHAEEGHWETVVTGGHWE